MSPNSAWPSPTSISRKLLGNHTLWGTSLAILLVVVTVTGCRESERAVATNTLADQGETLADLLMDADAKQFAELFPKFKEHGEKGVKRLLAELDRRLADSATEEDKEKLAKRQEKLAGRQANAAVALLRMGKPEKVWPLLKHSPDPRVRSYLIHRLGPLGTDARTIVKRLMEEPDVTIRRALVLSLGEFGGQAFLPGEQESLMGKLRAWYRTSDDPGLHAAAEWVLRQWKQDEWLNQTEQEWVKDRKQRDERLQGIRQQLAKGKGSAKPQWYVNSQGQTMVVIPGPVEFLMGSPTDEAEQWDELV